MREQLRAQLAQLTAGEVRHLIAELGTYHAAVRFSADAAEAQHVLDRVVDAITDPTKQGGVHA